MGELDEARLRSMLQPYLPDAGQELLDQLQVYLRLLLKWNQRTNLTAIRTPEEIVVRHFGESLFAARHVPPAATTLLDVGSGAGFPGLPILLARPDLRVTLAESQNKKATFLREVIRTLGVEAEVWDHRVESMDPARLFDVVTLRAVDCAESALRLAEGRATEGGIVLQIRSSAGTGGTAVSMPGGTGVVQIWNKGHVPRET